MKKIFKRKTDVAPVVMIPVLLVLAALLTLAACDNASGGEEVTLTFNANEGEPAPPTQSLGSGAKAEEPEAMTKADYVFGGWYREADFTTTPWDFETDTVTADTTLYAKWLTAYTVTFQADDGNPELEDQVVGSGEKATAPPTITKEGHVFVGWYKDEDLADKWNFASDTVNGDTTLYAKWTADSLVNTVWAGETPRAGDWLTITFKNLSKAISGSEETGARVIWSFNSDNSTNNWGYTYDDETKTGTIAHSGSWNPAPNGFSISEDGATLTVTNYGYHGGAPRDFKRLRDNEGNVAIAPESIDAPTRLAGSVWAGETPRTGDWLTISFKDLEKAIAGSTETGLRVIWSFSIDNTTNNWGYTYNDTTRTGTIAHSGSWNPAPNGFTINEDGTTLTVKNYGYHGGDPRDFKRLRAPDPQP
jgi:uncharacterized repeat protein (TIGR02543 family)